ncbi:MAG: Gldg family protein, partial [Myxococcota bacterium]
LESTFDEEAITNALVLLTSTDQHVICFTTGHNELDPVDRTAGVGLGQAVTRLEGQNYTTRSISLVREAGVPLDCEVVVAADPQYDFLPAEVELLTAHVASGGHLLLMLDPSHANGLAQEMRRFGLAMADDMILEMAADAALFGGDASYILLDEQSFDFHPITQPIDGFVLTRMVRSVSAGEPVEGINVQELIRTTPQAWTKTGLESITDFNPDPNTDRIGAIPLMAVAEVADPAHIALDPAAAPGRTRRSGARVAVIGDIDFATNELLLTSNNLDLLLNTLAWMVGEEDQISIRPNTAAEAGLTLNLLQGLLMWLICLVVAPGLTMLGALSTWRSRRNR